MAALLRETLLSGGSRAVVTVASSSMEPTLRAGDRVTIEGTDPSRLRRGDIVVYENPLAGLVVHRLMWRVPPIGEPRVAFTKGDALSYLDRPFAIGEVMGRVVAVAGSRGSGSIDRKVGGFRGLSSWLGAVAAMSWRRGLMGMARRALTHRKKR